MRKLHMPFLQITSAALNLYAAEGPRGVTMRRVARSVGVTAPAVYRHFLNKEALLDAVAWRAELWLGEALEKPKRLGARTNRVAAVAERALRFAVDHPHVFQLVSRRKPRWHRPPPGSAAEVVRYEVSQAISERPRPQRRRPSRSVGRRRRSPPLRPHPHLKYVPRCATPGPT